MGQGVLNFISFFCKYNAIIRSNQVFIILGKRVLGNGEGKGVLGLVFGDVKKIYI